MTSTTIRGWEAAMIVAERVGARFLFRGLAPFTSTILHGRQMHPADHAELGGFAAGTNGHSKNAACQIQRESLFAERRFCRGVGIGITERGWDRGLCNKLLLKDKYEKS